MSRLALFLIFGVCFASEHSLKEKVFRAGNDYHYAYEGQLLSGIPGASKLYSGLKMKWQFQLQFKSGGRVVMQMHDINVRNINDMVISSPNAQIPLDKFNELRFEEIQKLKSELAKACEFKYERGEITDFKCSTSEPFWSVNMKRGALNFFQLNLDERRAMSDIDDVLLRNALPKLEPSKSMFRVMEDGIDGKCESVYVIEPFCQGSKCSSDLGLTVIKTRDYSRCQDRSSIDYSMYRGFKCASCKEFERKIVEPSATMKLHIVGDRHNFLLKSAVLDSKFVYTPFSVDAGGAVTLINQTLVAVKTEVSKKDIELPKDLIRMPGGLKMELPSIRDLTKKKFKEAESSQNSIQSKIELIGTLVNACVDKIKTQDLSMVPTLTKDIIDIMKTCTKQELSAIFSQYCRKSRVMSDDQMKARRLILDILPTCGTQECVAVIIEQYIAGEIAPLRAAQMFTFTGMLAIPSEENVNKIMLLASKLSTMKREQSPAYLQRAVWLAASSLVSSNVEDNKDACKLCPLKTCSQCPELKKRITTLTLNADKWAKMLWTAYDKCQTQDERVMMLKAIGNSRLLEILPQLEKLIQNKKTPLPLRIQSIYCLRKLAHKIPHKVHSLALPILLNPKESHEARIAAYLMTMKTDPSRALLKMITDSMKKERSLQVGSFIYTHMMSLANTTEPCKRPLAVKCKLALLSARPFNLNLQFSRNMRYGSWNDWLQRGHEMDMSMVGDPHSVLPRSASYSAKQFLAGSHLNLFEAGYRAEGLQSIVDKYFDIEEIKNFFGDMLSGKITKSEKSSFEVKLSQSKQHKIKTATRASKDLSGSFYLKTSGNEFFAMPFNKNTLGELMDWVNFAKLIKEMESGKNIDWTKAVVVNDAFLVMPTTMGVPLNLNETQQFIASVTGTAKLSSTTKKRALKDVSTRITGSAGAFFETRGRFGVDASLFKCGVELKMKAEAKLPISVSARLSVPQQSLQISMDTPQQERRLMRLKSVPQTFFHYIRREQAEVTPKVDIREMTGEEINPPNIFSRSWGRQQFGLEVEMRGRTVNRTGKPFSPVHPFNSKQAMDILARPGNDKPEQLILTAYMKTKNPLSEKTHERVSSAESSAESSTESSTEVPVERSWWKQILQLSNDWISDSGEDRSAARRSDESSSGEVQSERNIEKIPLLSSESTRYEANIALQTKGSRKERQSRLNVVYQRTPSCSLRKVDAQFVCGHVKPEETRSWEVNKDEEPYKLKIKFEGRMESRSPAMSAPITEWNTAKIDSAFKLSWMTSSSQKTMDFKAVAEKSREQKQLIESGLQGWRQYKQCQADKAAGHKYSWACEVVQSEKESLNQIRVHTLEPISALWRDVMPSWMRNTCKKVQRYMIQMTSPQLLFIDDLPVNQKMALKMSLKRDSHQVDMETVLVPFTKVIVNGLMSPIPISSIPVKPMDHIPSILPEQPRFFMKTPLARASYHPQCFLTQDRVISFDGRKLPIPSTTCQILLAKDCSKEEKFSIIVQPLSFGLKKVIVSVQSKEIELVPNRRGSPSVLISGQSMSVPASSQKVPIRVPDDQSKILGYIDNKYDELRLTLKIGVEVKTDGQNVRVKVSPLRYPGKTCGVCGNNNGEDSDELTGPDMTKYATPEAVVASYLLPTDTCDASQVQRKHGALGEKCSLVSDHVIRRRVNPYNKPEVCVSQHKYPVCADGCTAVESTYSSHVSFYCVERSSYIDSLIEEKQLQRLAEISVSEGQLRKHRVPKAEKCVSDSQ